jgi:periplasmic protein TonB
MVNDRPHTAFPIASPHHLPLTGEFHPLRREFERWLATGNLITLLLAISIFSIWYFGRDLQAVEIDIPGSGPVIDVNKVPVPPPVSGRPKIDVPTIIPPENGVPDPVTNPDTSATIPTQEDLHNWGSWSDEVVGPGDVIVIPEPEAPGTAYQVFDELPVLIRIEPPVYPQIVRDAGIDGTVEVQVLVGRNGRVKEARAVSGSDVLHAAAVASARTAVFKPALQGTRPVEVLIVIPIVFELRGSH